MAPLKKTAAAERPAEAELEDIAGTLSACGYEVVLGFRDGTVATVFYNSGENEPVHSLHFEPRDGNDGFRELVGGFIARPVEDGESPSAAGETGAEHLFGAEVEVYRPCDGEAPYLYLGFAQDHIADGTLVNEFAAGGFDSPSVEKAMLSGHDFLMPAGVNPERQRAGR